MIDIRAIASLMDSKALVHVESVFGRLRLVLKEAGKDAKLKRVFVGGIPRDSILIKTDGAKPLNELLSKNLGQRCRCDYILLAERNGRNVLVFCELKSKTVIRSEITEQFKGSKCLVRYFEAMLQEFHGKGGVFPSSDEWYYVLFYKDSMRKRTSVAQRMKVGRSEKKFLWYPNPGIVNLLELVG